MPPADSSSSGSAYVFRTSDGVTYVEMAMLTASDAASGDDFGISVAIACDTIVVGARKDDDGGSDSGSAYVFKLPEGDANEACHASVIQRRGAKRIWAARKELSFGPSSLCFCFHAPLVSMARCEA